MAIPDEAVEAAAFAAYEAEYEGSWQLMSQATKAERLRCARAGLEAAIPHLQRVITRYEDLDDLPVETVIRTAFGIVREKNDRGYWYEMGSDDANGIEMRAFPAIVLHVPACNQVTENHLN